MKGFLRLFHVYIVRNLIRNPIRTILTVTGVALGISVVVGVHVVNERAISSLNNSLQIISGQADLQISANGLQLDEELIGELAWIWDVGSITAIIDGEVYINKPAKPAEGETIRVLGVDLLADVPFRNYTLDNGENLSPDITRTQFMNLLIEPNTIIITSVLGKELGLELGETVEVLVSDHWQKFQVEGILRNEGLAAAFGGKIVFMDIANAQTVFDRIGSIDRIEIVLNDPELLPIVEERIRSQLPASVVVYTPGERAVYNEKIIRAFRYNLTALSYIALIVGMILVYNTLNLSVARRRTEIGALRTLGTSRRLIKWMFLVEATMFGLIGAGIGIWCGEVLANTAGKLVSQTVSGLYNGAAAADSLRSYDPIFVIEMLILGSVLAAIAGTEPALRASKISPVGALRQHPIEIIRPRRSRTLAIGGISAICLGGLLAFGPPIGNFPFLGYASGIAFIAGVSLISPSLVRVLLGLIRRPVTTVFPAEGRLAIQTIESGLGRIVVAVMSLAIAVAMLISVAIMVASFRDTVIIWLDNTLKADLYLSPAGVGRNGGKNTLRYGTEQALKGINEIEAIDLFRSVRIDYNGFPAILAASEFATVASHGNLLFMNGRKTSDVAHRLIGANRVVISEPFAVRHSLIKGNQILLPTPSGMQPFEVEEVFYDYSSEGGLVVMDRGTYLSIFEDFSIGNAAVYLVPNANPIQVSREIVAALPNTQLRITTNRDLRTQVLRIFDQTFEITYALETIAIAIAVIGIANTLTALTVNRRPELAVLQFIGAAKGQIRKMILFEAGLIGALGATIGLVLGISLSLLLVYVINFQSFGWTIQFTMPFAFLGQSLAFVLTATILAGLYPASIALKMDPIKGIRAE